MALKTREVDDMFLDVWATMMYKRADALEVKMAGLDFDSLKFQNLKGVQEGIYQTLAMFSTLESGRFVKEYEKTKRELEEEKRESGWDWNQKKE